jgi:hypothetical protein
MPFNTRFGTRLRRMQPIARLHQRRWPIIAEARIRQKSTKDFMNGAP